MENKKNTPKLTLNSEEHELNGFYISELGFLMMSIGSQSGKRTNYNLGKSRPEQPQWQWPRRQPSHLREVHRRQPPTPSCGGR